MENLTQDTNHAELKGKIIGKATKTYEYDGENFYEFKLSVDRLSQVSDIIPVTISEKKVKEYGLALEEGQEVAFEGEFRSFNKIVDGKSRLFLHFFVQSVVDAEEMIKPNTVALRGFICKPPIYRTTPFNREICDILLAVNRTTNGKSDYIPCIAWGRNARFMQNQPVGTEVELLGRIQSRDYEKRISDNEIEKRTAYEVSCQSIALVEKSKQEEEYAS